MTNSGAVLDAIIALRNQFPGYTIDGIGPGPGDKVQASLDQIYCDALRHTHHFDMCNAWMDQCKFGKRFDRLHDTYTLKHEIEVLNPCRWVSHASLLIALQMRGIELKRNPDRPWAALIKVSRRPKVW